jgi:predicted lipoprotein with Yx(FWY)xxD motif
MKNTSTKSQLIRNFWIICLIAFIHISAIGQTSHIVDVTSNKFTPKEITISEGDTVIWTNSQGNHNVNGTQSTYPSNPEFFGNAVGVGWEFSHVFTLQGEYDYQCDPHVNFDMIGKVFVEALQGDTLDPDVVLLDDEVLGSILSDELGFTLYYFTKDTDPETSLCTDGCLDNWPLFYKDSLVVGEGLDMNDFGVIVHPSGGNQTTYKGWPLYYFVNDPNPGDTNGEAVGSVWFAAKPDYSIMLMDGMLTGKDGVTYNGNYEPGEEMVQYFVDEYGQSLYIFVNDTKDKNNFTAEDFSNNPAWPIYEKELMEVASTLEKSMFGSIEVFGHTQQTYKGWPLYYFGGDTQRGETMGVSVPGPGVWPIAVHGLEAPIVSSLKDLNVQRALRLYPNPAINELNISSFDEIGSISLLSLTGARIKTVSNIRDIEHVLSLEGITPGVYLIEVRTVENGVSFSSFIKQ